MPWPCFIHVSWGREELLRRYKNHSSFTLKWHSRDFNMPSGLKWKGKRSAWHSWVKGMTRHVLLLSFFLVIISFFPYFVSVFYSCDDFSPIFSCDYFYDYFFFPFFLVCMFFLWLFLFSHLFGLYFFVFIWLCAILLFLWIAHLFLFTGFTLVLIFDYL